MLQPQKDKLSQCSEGESKVNRITGFIEFFPFENEDAAQPLYSSLDRLLLGRASVSMVSSPPEGYSKVEGAQCRTGTCSLPGAMTRKGKIW